MQSNGSSPCSLPALIEGEHRFQRAWITPDLRNAITCMTSRFRVGPWFIQERFTPAKARCFGERVDIVLSVAFTFHGNTMLELLQQHTTHASPFEPAELPRAINDDRMHHVGIATSRFDDTTHRYLADGFSATFSADPPLGRLVMLSSPESPTAVELLEWTPRRRDLFEGIRQAAANWDGTQTIRHLTSTGN